MKLGTYIGIYVYFFKENTFILSLKLIDVTVVKFLPTGKDQIASSVATGTLKKFDIYARSLH